MDPTEVSQWSFSKTGTGKTGNGPAAPPFYGPVLVKWARKEPDMPLIEIHLLEGRTDEQKKALLTSVTRAVQESIGAPIESIRVWVQEFSPKEYMAAGVLAADKKK